MGVSVCVSDRMTESAQMHKGRDDERIIALTKCQKPYIEDRTLTAEEVLVLNDSKDLKVVHAMPCVHFTSLHQSMTSKWCFSFPSIDDDSCVVSCALVVLHMTENEAAEDDARCTTKKYGTWSCTDRTEREGGEQERNESDLAFIRSFT